MAEVIIEHLFFPHKLSSGPFQSGDHEGFGYLFFCGTCFQSPFDVFFCAVRTAEGAGEGQHQEFFGFLVESTLVLAVFVELGKRFSDLG